MNNSSTVSLHRLESVGNLQEFPPPHHLSVSYILAYTSDNGTSGPRRVDKYRTVISVFHLWKGRTVQLLFYVSN